MAKVDYPSERSNREVVTFDGYREIRSRISGLASICTVEQNCRMQLPAEICRIDLAE